MENKIRAVLLTTAAVLTAMLFWSWKHRPPEAVLVRTVAAETQDIYNSVTIFGTVESAESTAVCPAKNGVVSAVYAATGDTVQKGDTMWTIAQSQLGNGAEYQKILDANGLKESDTLAPGTVIKIPQ